MTQGKESAYNAGDTGDTGLIPGSGRSPGGENSYSSILAWEIPWTEEPGEFLQSSQSVQSLNCVRLFGTPGIAAHQACLSITNSRNLLKLIVHRVGGAIQSSHPLLSPFPPVFNLSQQQGPFQWVSSSHQVAKVLEFQFQHQSFQWIFRTEFL